MDKHSSRSIGAVIEPDNPENGTVRQSELSVWTNLVWNGSQVVQALWTHWQREKLIKQAVAELNELDDRTLRDIGIPHWSRIERVVRYGRES